MPGYEDFCRRTLATLQQERVPCEPACSPRARSVVRFYGRAVLSPLLSAERRTEMCGHRERALQQEVDRQSQQRSTLLARIQDILDQAQTHKVPSEDVDKLMASKSATLSGYTLVADSPGLPKDPGFGLQRNDRPPTPCPEPPTLGDNHAVEEVKVAREEKSAEEEEEEEDDISLDSLLKKSREYVTREQSQQGSKVPHAATDQDNKSCTPTGGAGIEFGFSLHHSPNGTLQNQIQYPTLYDSNLQRSGCLSPSLPDRYARLPSPESSISPCARRRRPRPVSTGNIHISFPIGPADLIPRCARRSGEGASVPDWAEALVGATKGSDGGRSDSRCGNRPFGHCGTSPALEACDPCSASMPGPSGHPDHPAAGFRRRCHTLDSQLHHDPSGAENIDRSQERVPRFMAGVSWLAPGRRPAGAPSIQSYQVESASPPHLRPDVTFRRELDDPQGPNNGRITSTVLRKESETLGSQTEQPQRRARALEAMQRRLEEEHALQMSLLLAKQEREQQRLCLELEETEGRLKEPGCARPQNGDGHGWNRWSAGDMCPGRTPSCPGLSPGRTPPEPAAENKTGSPSPVGSRVCGPSVPPPVYLWGPPRGAGKLRGRPSLVPTAEQQRALSRVGAITRGFLARRLLKTEKVQHLRQTIVDTQEFIGSFQTEAPQKKRSLSAQDLSLQERVRAQLRAALYDIHDIFFEMPLGDRLALLQQDRELRAERKLRDLEKNKCLKERAVLSAATQRSLDRKKRVGESPAQSRKMQQKPKSPTTNRVLKPSQCQNSPVPGQLNRQGSWYRKTPEERVKRSDSLKKQHSLG